MHNPYTVQLIDQKAIWEKFILTCPEANFLQSWNWGVFQQALAKPIFYLGLFQDQQQIGAALGVVETAKRGKYLAIAGGPLVDFNNRSAAAFFMKEIQRIARKNGCLFIRIRPQAVETKDLKRNIQQLGLMISPMHLTADLTLQLDLTPDLEAILAQMRKNTRYEIRQCDKLGIKVEQSIDLADIKMMYEHQLALAKKHHFVPFSYQFWAEQFKAFVNDDQVVLFHAYDAQHRLLATAFIIFYHGEAVYHYGTSTPENAKLPGSYACQWAAIQEAKARGCLKYNFWGIAPENQPEHRFAGVSLFKKGFGGEVVQYLPAHDLPLDWRYSFTRAFEFLRKKVRKL